ncbi:endonuclease domain-containing protein [Saccharopolyspora sp. 5N102]|uniref:endonuclease domain-containing protein n=1 Tax=Saccharopolyspora sp. 5N102 TaxID=3375155 RepID=UPI0037B2551F
MTLQAFPPEIGDTPHKLFLRSDAIAAGLTDWQLRGSAFRKVLHGVYTTCDTQLTHELKCAAAAMTLPSGSVITGRSAATLRGVPLADFRAPVEVIVPREDGMLRRKGLRCTATRAFDFEHSSWRGIGVAGFPRISFDILKQRSMSQAVAYCDALLHAGSITIEEIAGFLVGRKDHGIVRARMRLEHLDGRAESVPESILRVELALCGLRPVPQLEVFDGDGFVARVDLAFEAARVAVEYDGGWHADPAQIKRDEIRRNRLRSLGWVVIVVTNDQLREGFDQVVARIRAALKHQYAISIEIGGSISMEIA